MDSSGTTIRSNSVHHNLAEIVTQSTSQPSSPRSSALPSPPDSPDSVSSFPSVSSSFFFSSAAASPPHPHAHLDHIRDPTQGLIIPSLTLPAALRRPTLFGQTVGDIKLLVLASKAAGKGFLSGLLVEDNEDVVEVGIWEEAEYGSVLRASTDWIEHRDAHGLENFEPSRNLEIIELPGYDTGDDPHALIQSLISVIQTPFYSISEVLHPKHKPSTILANLVSSPSTPLYTALILLLPSSPSPLEHLIIDNLCPQIPIIVLPRQPNHSRCPTTPKVSSFRPASPIALRIGLFRSPETLSTLRHEATSRFLRWREVERAVDSIRSSRREVDAVKGRDEEEIWSKAKWESEWEASLSQDVARRMRQGTLTEKNVNRSMHEASSPRSASCVSNPFDPLHLPSLFMFSVSLLGPLQSRVWGTIIAFAGEVKLALVGGFCVGLGIGLFLR